MPIDSEIYKDQKEEHIDEIYEEAGQDMTAAIDRLLEDQEDSLVKQDSVKIKAKRLEELAKSGYDLDFTTQPDPAEKISTEGGGTFRKRDKKNKKKKISLLA